MFSRVILVFLVSTGLILAADTVHKNEKDEYSTDSEEHSDAAQAGNKSVSVAAEGIKLPYEEPNEIQEIIEEPVEDEFMDNYEEEEEMETQDLEEPYEADASDSLEETIDDYHEEPINDETELVFDLLTQNLIPERFKSEGFFKTWGLDIKSRLQQFQWRDCGGSAAHIVSMSVGPDPIKLPGTMKIGAVANVISALKSPLQTNLTIEKKIIGKYVKIPCLGEFGSCMYDDLCDILYSATCPEVLTKNGIPCVCPYDVKNYTLPVSNFDAESLFFPGGDYHVIGELHQNGKKLACLELYLSLTS